MLAARPVAWPVGVPLLKTALGPALYGSVHLLLGNSLPPAPRHVLGVALWMAAWWTLEVLPQGVTALLPVLVLPAVGAVPLAQLVPAYSHPLLGLFLGGFWLALGIERWGLHRWAALHVLGRSRGGPRKLVGGLMGITALLSMGLSNTATVLMMAMLATGVVAALARQTESEASPTPAEDAPPPALPPPLAGLGKALLLGVAYGASVGGIGTLIGTPPNAMLVAELTTRYGQAPGFATWLVAGLPLALAGLVVVWWLLTRVLHPLPKAWPANLHPQQQALGTPGRLTPTQWRVLAVVGLTAAAWVLRKPVLNAWVPQLSDAGVALLGGGLLFALPHAEGHRLAKGPLLSWADTRRLPWGILLLFGGGLALAAAFRASGLDALLASGLGGLASWPPFWGLLALSVGVVLATDLSSNISITAVALPVVAELAASQGLPPLPYLAAATFGASAAFSLPVSTAPNAIVYATGQLRVVDFLRAGLVLTLPISLLVAAAARWLVPWVWAAVAP